MEGSSNGSSASGTAERWAKALERAGGQKLRTYVRRIVGSAEATEAILQAAYEKFWKGSAPSERENGEWLRAVILSLAASYLRNRRRE